MLVEESDEVVIDQKSDYPETVRLENLDKIIYFLNFQKFSVSKNDNSNKNSFSINVPLGRNCINYCLLYIWKLREKFFFAVSKNFYFKKFDFFS